MTLLDPASSTTAAADAQIDPRHPFARHLQRVDALDRTAPHRAWTPDDGPLPSLYLSHGAPPLFEDAAWMDQLVGWARDLPKPTAVLIVSAHWESEALAISSTVPRDLVYDFSGFAPTYSAMRFDTPEASALAAQLTAVMPDGETLYEHRGRGLDHGAWVPLKVMYPHADVPVLQLSLPTHASTDPPARDRQPAAHPARAGRAGGRLRLHDARAAARRLAPARRRPRLVRRLRRLGRRRARAAATSTSCPPSAPAPRACATPTPRSSTSRRCSSPSAPPPTRPPRSPPGSTAGCTACRGAASRPPDRPVLRPPAPARRAS